MAFITNVDMIQKMKAAFGLRGRTINKVSEYVRPVMVCNDEENPIATHAHGPHPLPTALSVATAGRADFVVNVPDNKGGFTTKKAFFVAGTAVAEATDQTILTVTTGRTYHVYGLTIQEDLGTQRQIALQNMNEYGAFFRIRVPANSTVVITGNAPIMTFDSGVAVVIDAGTAASGRVQIWGYEVED